MEIRLTKFGHSCVLVETDDRDVLIDPGVWSEEFDTDSIDNVDRLVVTHEHPDHMDVVKIKEVLDKFADNDLKLVCNKAVQAALEKAGIEANFSRETNCTKPFESPHESIPVPGVSPPDCTGYHVKGIFSHPGDSHSFSETKDILALPIVAPWGNPVDAIDVMLRVKPKHVLLVHDWHLSREGFDWYQDVVASVCEENGINFIRIANGKPVTLEV